MKIILLTGALALISCSAHRTGGSVKEDSGVSLDGDAGSSSGADLSMSLSGGDDLLMSSPDLFGVEGGIGAYSDLSIDRDASGCAPGQTGTGCANAVAPNAGCSPNQTDPEICGNGLDDNCDGRIDEGCPCTPGAVQPCFQGPPGKRNIGGCTDGTQTCIGSAEFGSWDVCVGSIGPSPERCDGLDNDCNGCVDDELCCNGGVLCPGPNDPRIAPVAPFATKSYTGSDFFNGNGVTWTWTVVGGPCDKLFASPGFTPASTPPAQSFKLMNANTANPSIYFSLSGDYTVTMTVVDDKGQTYTCTWVQHVVGPGVRFELCWDHQGTTAQGGADLDLHIHKSGSTGVWFGTTADHGACRADGSCSNRNSLCNTTINRCIQVLTIDADDCHYNNCTALTYQTPSVPVPAPAWYPNSTPATNCQGNAKYGATWMALGYCGNPRLDLDNILTPGMPENSNIDDPQNGDSFRAMVHYYGRGINFPCSQNCASLGLTCNTTSMLCADSDGNTDFSDPSFVTLTEHPIVNVYCGGALKATYGQAPDQIQGFNWGSTFGTGQIWRVADVAAQVDNTGKTTDCTVTPIHPPGMMAGYYVITDKTNTDMSY